MSSKEFRDRVYLLWSDCIAREPRAWQNDNNVIGEALMVDYPFVKEKILLHAKDIAELIALVHLATTYEEMKFLDTGEKWSELRQPVSMLMALGNTLKLVDFKNSRLEWSKEETRNPEITFTLK